MLATIPSDSLHQLAEEGFTLLRGLFFPKEVDEIVAGLETAFATKSGDEGALRGLAGGLCGARNVLTLWPPAAEVWRRSGLTEVLSAVLGSEFGLVRVLYFDKPPGQSWALPWHKDLTVALREVVEPGENFRKPTRKGGVPHAEAPLAVLQEMLTARVHLDEVTEENGPLKVLPGSHLSGKELHLSEAAPVSVLAERGDVLLMRPLLAHRSGRSDPLTSRQRRILHFEFAASPDLPDGCAWHTFSPPPWRQ